MFKITVETPMLKTIVTLFRGAAFRAEEEFADRSALLILDQQIRDSAAGIERAKRALAVAIAQDEAEGKRLETTLSRIADLEERAVAALSGGSDELAAEAAEAIAVMEMDRDSIREARATFAREIAGLKAAVRKSGQRLAELERGRRIALAAESVRRLKTGYGLAGPSGATTVSGSPAPAVQRVIANVARSLMWSEWWWVIRMWVTRSPSTTIPSRCSLLTTSC